MMVVIIGAAWILKFWVCNSPRILTKVKKLVLAAICSIGFAVSPFPQCYCSCSTRTTSLHHRSYTKQLENIYCIVMTSNIPVISCYNNIQINNSYLMFLSCYQKYNKIPAKELKECDWFRVCPRTRPFMCSRSAISPRIKNIQCICVYISPMMMGCRCVARWTTTMFRRWTFAASLSAMSGISSPSLSRSEETNSRSVSCLCVFSFCENIVPETKHMLM